MRSVYAGGARSFPASVHKRHSMLKCLPTGLPFRMEHARSSADRSNAGHRWRRRAAVSVWNKAYEKKGKGWKGKGRHWEDQRFLRDKAQRQMLQPSAALPVVAGLAVASMFGPLVFSIAASAIGLAFATVAGMTAVALFLPAAFFIGGTLAALSILGSLFALFGAVPLLGLGWYWFKRSGRAKLLAAEREAAIKRDEWQAKEYRRQQEELELIQTQEEELENFDRRLRSR